MPGHPDPDAILLFVLLLSVRGVSAKSSAIQLHLGRPYIRSAAQGRDRA
jgi:hypothetical protein